MTSEQSINIKLMSKIFFFFCWFFNLFLLSFEKEQYMTWRLKLQAIYTWIWAIFLKECVQIVNFMTENILKLEYPSSFQKIKINLHYYIQLFKIQLVLQDIIKIYMINFYFKSWKETFVMPLITFLNISKILTSI